MLTEELSVNKCDTIITVTYWVKMLNGGGMEL